MTYVYLLFTEDEDGRQKRAIGRRSSKFDIRPIACEWFDLTGKAIGTAFGTYLEVWACYANLAAQIIPTVDAEAHSQGEDDDTPAG